MLLLENELSTQHITNYRIWNGCWNRESPVKGIYKAHKQILEWAKTNRCKEICIAEDDIQFSAPGAFNYFLRNKPSNFDIYLGGITWGEVKDDHTILDFAGTMLYIVAEHFYDTILRLPEIKDYDRSMAGLGNFFVCDPMVACQHNGYSDNQKRNMDFGPIKRRMKWFT